jgi:hypothetical protein
MRARTSAICGLLPSNSIVASIVGGATDSADAIISSIRVLALSPSADIRIAMLSKADATSGKRFVKKETHPQVELCDRVARAAIDAQLLD